MKRLIIFVGALVFCGCSHSTSHMVKSGHHFDASGAMMPNCPMMKHYRLRDKPEAPLIGRDDMAGANSYERAILDKFDEIEAVSYSAWDGGVGVEIQTKSPINRIQMRKIGTKIADIIRKLNGNDDFVEVSANIAGVGVSKRY